MDQIKLSVMLSKVGFAPWGLRSKGTHPESDLSMSNVSMSNDTTEVVRLRIVMMMVIPLSISFLLSSYTSITIKIYGNT